MENLGENIDDLLLLAGLKYDSSEAFTRIFEKYYTNLVMFAGQFIPQRHHCEDIVQGVFASIWENRHGIEIDRSFKSYILKLVQNRCLDEIKHRKVRLQYESDSHVQLLELSPDEYVFYNELNERLNKMIDSLPEAERETLLLHRMTPLKQTEIARRMGVSVRTVEARISRAINKLRKGLGDIALTIALLYNIA